MNVLLKVIGCVYPAFVIYVLVLFCLFRYLPPKVCSLLREAHRSDQFPGVLSLCADTFTANVPNAILKSATKYMYHLNLIIISIKIC